jgi:hypothetical protein
MLRFWEGRIWFRCFPARNRDWAQRPKNPCFIGRARRDPEWAVLVTIKFPGAARTLARRLEDRAFAASRVADDRTMRTQNTPVIAAQAAAARDWTVSRIRRKPSSGAMHIVRYVFRKGSQPPVRTSLLVRAAGYLPDISGSCSPSRVSPRVYWCANFKAVAAFSAFSLWGPFRHLRNKMQQRPSISPTTFGQNPPMIGLISRESRTRYAVQTSRLEYRAASGRPE